MGLMQPHVHLPFYVSLSPPALLLQLIPILMSSLFVPGSYIRARFA
jgi:hypothetical protein